MATHRQIASRCIVNIKAFKPASKDFFESAKELDYLVKIHDNMSKVDGSRGDGTISDEELQQLRHLRDSAVNLLYIIDRIRM